MSGAPAVVPLTGATGFVGKVVLAELLRRREALGIERVLALVRAKDPEQADARLRSEVLGSPCFTADAPRYEKWIEAVAGDITQRIIRRPTSFSRARPRASGAVITAARSGPDAPMI
jgi:alcohol-forming fatty acyl-CoA reductase